MGRKWLSAGLLLLQEMGYLPDIVIRVGEVSSPLAPGLSDGRANKRHSLLAQFFIERVGILDKHRHKSPVYPLCLRADRAVTDHLIGRLDIHQSQRVAGKEKSDE